MRALARVSSPELSVPQRPTTSRSPGDGMLRTGRFAWGLLGVAGVAVLLWVVLSRLTVVVVPLMLALLPAAALAPLVAWMVRHGVPRVLAALLALIGLLAVIGGLVAVVIPLRPFVVIIAVAVGATLLGVLGAFLTVPVAACIARAFGFLRERQAKDGRGDDFRHREAAVPDGRARST